MSQPIRTTICIFNAGDCPEDFHRCLESVLRHTPLEDIEIRLGFAGSPHGLYQALGLLCADGASPQRHELPGGIEKFSWTATSGLKVHAWLSPFSLPRERLARLLYHDRPLESDYIVALDGASSVEAGWWEALALQMKQGFDYVGQSAWHDYSQSQLESVRTHSWFMGLPFDRREGRPGVWFVPWGFLAIRSERLREADFPNLGAQHCKEDILLGEIARQLGWKHVNHCDHVHVKPR